MSIGASRNFASEPLTTPLFFAFISPSPVIVIGLAGGLTSPDVTIHINGEVNPIVILWEKVSGDDISISATDEQVVTFSANGTSEVKNATYKCTVTDDTLAVQTDTADITFVFA